MVYKLFNRKNGTSENTNNNIKENTISSYLNKGTWNVYGKSKLLNLRHRQRNRKIFKRFLKKETTDLCMFDNAINDALMYSSNIWLYEKLTESMNHVNKDVYVSEDKIDTYKDRIRKSVDALENVLGNNHNPKIERIRDFIGEKAQSETISG